MATRHDDDAALVLAARAGDSEAFTVLFDRWFDRSYDVAWRIVRNRDTAAEVAQDALLAAWQGLDDLRDPGAFGGWVLRTARNRALNRLQKDGRSPLLDAEVAIEARGAEAPAADVADGFVDAERDDLVWAAAATLGERDASLLDLHLRHGLDAPALAEALGVTPNNVHQLLFRLKKKLAVSIRAWVLWHGGQPRCDELASLLATAGATAFDATTSKLIDGHAETCDRCEERRTAVLSPEAMFAAVPLLPAPLLVKQQAAAALAAQGAPIDVGAVGSAPATGAPDVGGDGDRGDGVDGLDATDGPTDGGPGTAEDIGTASPIAGSPPGAPALIGPGVTPASTDDAAAPRPGGRRLALVAAVVAALLVALVVLLSIGREDDQEVATAELAPSSTAATQARSGTSAGDRPLTAPSSSAPTSMSSSTSTSVPAPAPTTVAPTSSTRVPAPVPPPPTAGPTTTAASVPSTTSTTSPPPGIGSFTATGQPPGSPGCQSFERQVLLAWSVSGATSVRVAGPAVADTPQPGQGSTTVCLPPGSPNPATWTLTASGPGGSTTRDTTG